MNRDHWDHSACQVPLDPWENGDVLVMTEREVFKAHLVTRVYPDSPVCRVCQERRDTGESQGLRESQA